jgi:hypothetical protein
MGPHAEVGSGTKDALASPARKNSAWPTDLVQEYLRSRKDPRKVRADVHARYFGAELTEDMLLPRDAAHLGAVKLRDWLQMQSPAQ